jgi:NTP pyrophosphatase (non-canonical NTP hydrolase)
MNKQEYLLACLSEECGEVIRAIGKIQRFGLNDMHPHKENPEPNNVLLCKEINDVLTIVGMLQEEGVDLPKLLDPAHIIQKREKVNKYMQYSKDRGALVD